MTMIWVGGLGYCLPVSAPIACGAILPGCEKMRVRTECGKEYWTYHTIGVKPGYWVSELSLELQDILFT